MFANTSAKRHLKMFKRMLEFLRKCNKSGADKAKKSTAFDCSREIADNLANEALLTEIVVESQQVCYLRTEAGDFFWNYEKDCRADADLIHF